jgi:hypothetical protein
MGRPAGRTRRPAFHRWSYSSRSWESRLPLRLPELPELGLFELDEPDEPEEDELP